MTEAATLVTGAVVLCTALFLLVQGLFALLDPDAVRRFLDVFASSRTAHYVELLLRLMAGVSFWYYAANMAYPNVFLAFGWILIVTSAALLVLPWQWHRRFALAVVPVATRNMWLYAPGPIILGGFIVYSVLAGPGTTWIGFIEP